MRMADANYFYEYVNFEMLVDLFEIRNNRILIARKLDCTNGAACNRGKKIFQNDLVLRKYINQQDTIS